MAQTLPNGVVVPNADGQEPISATGIAEMRALGVSTDAQLAAAAVRTTAAMQATTDVDSSSRARDEALEALIAGMEGMTYVGAWEQGRVYRINDVVTHGGDSWARLTAGSAGEPGAAPEHWGLVARKGAGGGFGELTETDVTGLYDTVDSGIQDQVDALSGTTGLRDIAGDYPEIEVPGQGGLLLSRVGNLIQVSLYGIRVPDATAGQHLSQFLPAGFRPLPGVLLMIPVLQGNTDTIRFRVTAAGQMTIYNHNGATLIYGSATFATADDWPATLPGTPA